MTITLNSYISFRNNAKEAAEFYHSIFGGELYVDTFEKYSNAMPVHESDKDKVMHAHLKGDNGIELMMSDTPTGLEYDEGSRITLALNGDDEQLLRTYWDKLSEGGVVTMPLDVAPWGDTFGMFTDQFGVNWMVAIGPTDYT